MEILVVIDMQKDFVDGALGTSEAQAIVPNVVNKIKNFKGFVLATRDTHYEDYLETSEGIMLPVPHCIVGTPGYEIIPEVTDAITQNENIIFANKYSIFDKPTFGSTALMDRLRVTRPDKITIIGLCTDICVVSNALMIKAACPEVPIEVDASCCAGVTPESHKAALTTMKMCQINVVNE